MHLLEVVEGAEEASLDGGHVRRREVGVVLGGGVWARPQQRHEAGCHNVRAELGGGGARGGGCPAVRGGLPPQGAQRDFPQPPVRGDLPGPLGPLGKAIHRPAKALVAAADGEQRVQGLALPPAPDVGVVGLVLPGVRAGPRVVRGGGGGVVGGEEGVGAVYYPMASWCVVLADGEGVVYVVHEGHVRGGGWLLVVGGGDISREVVPEVAQGGHPVDPCLPFPLLRVAGGGAAWGVGHVGLVVADAALGVHAPRHGVSDKLCCPESVGGAKIRLPGGGRALAIRGGERGAVVSGDVEEGVKEEVSDALPEPRVAAWSRVAARMRWVVPEVWRRSTSWSPSPRRCCRTASGLCRA